MLMMVMVLLSVLILVLVWIRVSVSSVLLEDGQGIEMEEQHLLSHTPSLLQIDFTAPNPL